MLVPGTEEVQIFGNEPGQIQFEQSTLTAIVLLEQMMTQSLSLSVWTVLTMYLTVLNALTISFTAVWR